MHKSVDVCKVNNGECVISYDNGIGSGKRRD